MIWHNGFKNTDHRVSLLKLCTSQINLVYDIYIYIYIYIYILVQNCLKHDIYSLKHV